MRENTEYAIEILYSTELNKWFQSINLYRFWPEMKQAQTNQVSFFEVKERDANQLITVLKLETQKTERADLVWYRGRAFEKHEKYRDSLLSSIKKTLLKNK